MLKPHHLNDFIAQKLQEEDIFGLLNDICDWLRSDQTNVSANFSLLIHTLKQDRPLAEQFAGALCRWICSMRLYPLFISRGILSRSGFGREMKKRLYEKINPSFKDSSDLRDVFFLLFKDKNDSEWLSLIPLAKWDKLFRLLYRKTTPHERETLQNHFRYEGLFAIKMLSIWIAAEDIEPELMRLDPSLLSADSPFVELQKEVSLWIAAQNQQQPFDDAHLQVMFEQSKSLIERLQKKGATQGSSLGVAYLLERLSQSLERLSVLMGVFASNRFLPRRMLLLIANLAQASADKHSVRSLLKQSVRMLSRSITQNASDHGEHYIAHSSKEYFAMFYSAAGGGVLIALMALLKIYLGTVVDDKVWRGVLEGLNYGFGFTLIFMLHFTVATKQPAMTAARFAEAVGQQQGKAVNTKLAQLLMDVIRSQTAAVLGNVLIAVLVASVVATSYEIFADKPLLTQDQVAYQLHSIDPLSGTLWFAAIAGVWLFCAGIIAGFFDNRCNYLNMRMRLTEHPLLKRIMPLKTRVAFAEYIHKNYGAIMGNLCFGMLLGLTGVVGYLSGLPLDIRHIAFSSANVGYAVVSGDLGCGIFLQSLFFILLIGTVNLAVSFSLTLFVALRSLNAEIDSWKNIAQAFWQQVKRQPLSLFFPVKMEKEQ
ncbi:site-specific recombinase [Caviibacterium pharyngocola]|uniref:Recombinase n=1 Tax=Caviibacterium pharyngocola TaxID=28159 RepID=A0A2M8RUI5_9PAST|nr:recombinase [Caviibacterium pharyngocola]PJG82544.1 recombinase [Caviibacterium pharyngocola]